MEHQPCKIKNGDTLESIAKRLRVDAEELRRFHNRNAHFTNAIPTDHYLPKHVEELLIPVDLSALRKKYVPQSLTIRHDNTVISGENIAVSHSSAMKMNGAELFYAKTAYLFAMRKDIGEAETVCTIDKKQVVDRRITPMYQALSDRIDFISIPLNRLVLKLDETGKVRGIANQDEINARWQSLKTKPEVNELFSDETGRQMEKSGDDDFKDSLRLVKETLLYRLLCPDIFGDKEPGKRTSMDTDLKLASNFFTTQKVGFRMEEESRIESENDCFILKRRYTAQEDTPGKVLSTYNAMLKDFLRGSPLEYSFTIDCRYRFSYDTMTMIAIDCRLMEKLNDSASFSNEITVNFNNPHTTP